MTGTRMLKRGGLCIAINPSDKKATVTIPGSHEKIFEIGSSTISGTSLFMEPQSFVVLKLR